MTASQFNYSFLNKDQLPLLLQPQIIEKNDPRYLIHFLTEENGLFKEHLLHHGAILFRGFNVNDPDTFLEIIKASSLGPHYNYDFCPVPRTKLREGVFTSSNFPATYTLALHNEKSYSSEFPSHVFFNCNTRAETGGYTSLADGNKIWFSLPDFLQKKLQSKGILYRKHYYADKGLKHKLLQLMGINSIYKTWRSEFKTANKDEVERILDSLGQIFQWKGPDLITEKFLPACYNHPITGKIVWFNQSNQLASHCNSINDYIYELTKNPLTRFILLHKKVHPHVAYYGDGESISKQESIYISQAFQKNTLFVDWQPGDVMIIDNYSCLHGKTAHTGNRLILAGMTKYPY